MISKRLKRSLRRIVGQDALFDDPARLGAYAYDSSLQTATPAAVLFPQTTQHVAQIVSLLAGEGIPYVARGAGTNLSGGSIPLKGGAVIALARMKRILSIETGNFCARVEPGLTNLALQQVLAKRGFFYAPDPASQKVSTIGGNLAENSGGPHCLKYGVTTNHILGAKIVTPQGDIMELGGETLDGPDTGLLGLLVGSEGTLGIATEIVCRITPLPEAVKTMLAVFDSAEQAGRTVSEIIAAGILPATLEMMDNVVIRAVEQSLHAGYPTDADAVLIIEVDGPTEGLNETAAEIESICNRNEVREVRTARDESEREQLWAGRRGAFGAVASLFPNYSVSDGTVPRTKLPDVLRRVAEIGRKHDLEIGNVFHAGDGNLHPLIFFDSRNRTQMERVHRASEEILDVCVEVGGTITGEHGVGTEKIKAMPQFFGTDEIELMRAVKNALDPAGACNPGKILPDAGARRTRETEHSGRPDRFSGMAGKESEPLSPGSPDELAALVRELSEAGKSFAPVGANTLFHRLPANRSPDVLIQTTAMRAIIEHDAANLTATVQAGVTVGDLQKALAEAGQFVPLDAPPDATCGGAVASALPGPRRHIYGAARDFVLGLRFADAYGTTYRAGGRTVKNVAGYDFGKLLIGAWGTLGIITEITFRVLPAPQTSRAFLAAFDRAEDAQGAAAEIVSSRLEPAIATLLNSDAVAKLAGKRDIPLAPAGSCLVLGAEGFAAAAGRRLAEFERICRERGASDCAVLDPEAYGPLVAAIAGLSRSADVPAPPLSVAVTLRCKNVVGAVGHIQKLALEDATSPIVIAHLNAGFIYSHFPSPEDAGRLARKIVDTIIVRFSCANTSLLGCGNSSQNELPFITGNRGGAPWRRAIKACLDPKDLLNPGMRAW